MLAQVTAATRGVIVSVPVVPIATGNIANVTGAATALTTAQQAAVASSQSLAGAQATLAASTQKSTASLLGAASASARLDAALLGLRTAVGSTAVIGLGALALAAIAAGKAISASLKNFIDFQQELKSFSVIAGATAQQMQAVREAAARLGADVRLPAISAADAAVAMTELAKAGLSVEDAIAGAEGVLQLATAAQISNADAALIAANALNSFGLAGDQAARVADDLANAANAAQGSITDFGIAFRQSSAVARQVGLSLEDTTSLLALLAKNGLQGSDAGTSLRVALIRLVAPTKQAAAEIRKLGLDIRDAQGNLRADVFAQFGEATKNLSPAVRDASAALIFGQDAIRAVSIGAREGTEGLRLMQFQIDQTGTAAEVAAARTEGLGGSFSALQSSAETLSVNFGKLLSVGLKPYVDIAVSVVTVTNRITDSFDRLVTASLNVETPIGRVKDRLVDIASIGVPIVGEVRLIRRGFRELGIGVDEDAEKVRTLQEQLQNLQKARIAAEQGGQRSVADRLTKEIQALREEIAILKGEGKGITSSVTEPLQDAVEQLEKVRDVRITLGADTTGIDRLIASLKESIPITQQVEGNIARLRDDFGTLGDKARQGATGVDALTKALRDLSTQSARAQAELLRLQTEGGTPQEQIAVLQADIEAQFDIIARQRSRGGAPGAATAIKQAREQIKSDQAQIEALQNEIAADAKKAATEAEKRRDELDAALLRQFEAATSSIERLLGRAAGTESRKDDIKFTEQLIAIYRDQIAQARKRIKDADTRNRVLKALGDELFNALQDRKRLAREERERLRGALIERQEQIIRGTELDVELADINENTRKRISLRLKLIAQLRKEAKILKLTGNALKENRNEIARINKEIEEIRGEGKETGKSFANLAFEFLQQQQGFAANLLGNLIPLGATGGLVGGPPGGGVIKAAAPQREIRTTAAISQARERGVTGGQGDTTNALLRQILQALRANNRREAHPEATHQRRTSGSAMDVM